MPQKYDKNMKALPGYTANPETVKLARDNLEFARARKRSKAQRRRFLAEPEELKILETLERMPIEDRLAAAEGLLIARRYRKKKIT